jgi:hypothetical protein
MTLQEEFKKETGIRLILTDEGNGFIEDYVFWLERKIESHMERMTLTIEQKEKAFKDCDESISANDAWHGLIAKLIAEYGDAK